jgi:hypothetical protein
MKNEKLTQRQEALIAALLTEKTISSACKKTKITTATYYEWIKNPAFSDRLRLESSQIFAESRRLIRQTTIEAVGVLKKLLTSKKENLRRLAALAILDYGFKDNEADFANRLEKIEKIVFERRTFSNAKKF